MAAAIFGRSPFAGPPRFLNVRKRGGPLCRASFPWARHDDPVRFLHDAAVCRIALIISRRMPYTILR